MKKRSLSWKVLLVLLLSGIAALDQNNSALGHSPSSSSNNQSDPPYHDNIFPNGGGLRDRLLGVLGNRFSKVPAGLEAHRRAGDYFNRNQLEDVQYAIEQSYSDEHRYYSNENINPSPMSLSVAQIALLRSERITESATALAVPIRVNNQLFGAVMLLNRLDGQELTDRDSLLVEEYLCSWPDF